MPVFAPPGSLPIPHPTAIPWTVSSRTSDSLGLQTRLYSVGRKSLLLYTDSTSNGKWQSGRKKASADRSVDVCGVRSETLGRRRGPEGRGLGFHRGGTGGRGLDPTVAGRETVTAHAELRGQT